MNKSRILIVEDERITSIYIAKLLKANGYNVAGSISSGEEAVENALRNKPDLILMDITLDGSLDGIEAAEIIRNELITPIIFLTAYSNIYIKERILKISSTGYLTKPIDKMKFLNLIKQKLNKLDN